MARIETIAEGITLYYGDCREIVPSLGVVDAVVTDPPYGTEVTTWDISIDAGTVSAILAASKGYSAFFYSNTRLAHILNAVRGHGHDAWVAVWHKSNAMGLCWCRPRPSSTTRRAASFATAWRSSPT